MSETPRFLYHGTTLDGYTGIRNHSLDLISMSDIAKCQQELHCNGDGLIVSSIGFALKRSKDSHRIDMPVLLIIDASKHRDRIRWKGYHLVRQPLEKDGYVAIDLKVDEKGRMDEPQTRLLMNLQHTARELSDFLRAKP